MALILLAALQIAALFLLPIWWSTAALSFLWAVFRLPKGRPTALFFFLAGLLSWGGAALYYHLAGKGLLTKQMAEVFHLPTPLLLLLTAVLGGLLSMLSGLVPPAKN